MKKIFTLMACALVALAALAVPAVPTPIQVTQPDGTQLTIRIVGDEFFNYHTTADGYTIVRDKAGYFVYAQSQNDDLVPSEVVAHNVAERSASEAQFVNTLPKGLFSKVDARAAKQKRASVDAATKAAGAKAAQYDYSNFRGLIVLVDYSDCRFTRSDVQNFYYRMANEENYTGFTNEDGSPNYYGACTGSVRDYYYDNSQGRFDPTFDVVGPVLVNGYSVDSHNKTDNSAAIWAQALSQLDPQVDFSQYDRDGDGNIDMIYFIGAGSGSNSDGTTTHLWPHKWDLYWENVTLDGKRARTYACSTEYLYSVNYGVFDGIGTICHEFSHVLGLPDLYDTDYEQGGGQSQHPGKWDIMAGGSYENNSRTPVAYSLYDRYSIGFANAQIINAKGEYSLNQVGTTGEGYIIKSPESQVKFYLENRQNTKWDAYAPGHGMIICRVDSTNSSVWDSNDVNCDPSHNYYVLLRAGNGDGTAQADDAFPAGATFINNTTTPNLKTWNGLGCQYNITNIREQNGVIYFTIGDDTSLHSVVEDFEEMPVVTTPPSADVQGVYSKWKFVNCYVTNPSSDYCNGEHSTVMKRPSSLTMTQDVRYKSYMVSFDAYNASTTAAKFILYCSTDNGTTWTAVANADGETSTNVAANSSVTLKYTFDMNVPARYRISMTAGATTYKTYIDDFTIYYTDVIPEPATPLATVLTEGVNGNDYLIADDLAVVEVAQSEGFAFLTDGNDNWIKVDAGSYYNALAAMNTVAGGSLKGTFTGKDFIPTLTLSQAPEQSSTDLAVTPKTYSLAQEFAPKVNEVISVGGYYNASDNALRAYSAPPQGQSLTIDNSWINGWTPVNGSRYSVIGIIQIKEPWAAPAPVMKDYEYPFQNYVIYPVSVATVTAVEALNADGNALVNVYNMQGQLIKRGVRADVATQGLPAGLYLVGGKKVVVK